MGGGKDELQMGTFNFIGDVNVLKLLQFLKLYVSKWS